MADVQMRDKRVFIRADLNVPIKQGAVVSDARIVACLPTLRWALEAGAAVVVLSHLGRPQEGQFSAADSLLPVADKLGELLKRDLTLLADLSAAQNVAPGHIGLLENVRFMVGEKANDDALAKTMAAACDVFVMDAFGTAHRAHASTHGIAKYADVVCVGLLLEGELNALEQALAKPERPMVAIVGGAKVSTKLEVLGSLANLADEVIVGGGIANTFIAAVGHNVGRSLYEADLVEVAKDIAAKVTVPIPTDVMVGKNFAETETAIVKSIDEVLDDEMIMDIGPVTARAWAARLASSKTILWNGPVGVFEFDQFGEGTRVLAEAIAQSPAFSIAGGGDTLAAIDKYDVRADVSYISTGGGAFLEFVEGKPLPAVEILKQRAKRLR